MAGTAAGGGVEVSRAAVLHGMARFEGAVQADGDRGGVGGVATADEHGSVHDIFWAAGEVAFGWAALSGFLFCGAGSVDIFFERVDESDQCGGGKPALDHKSLFSAADPSAFGGAVRAGGFPDCVCGADRDRAGIWNPAGGTCVVAAGVPVAGSGDGAGNGVVDFGAECVVPGRGVCDGFRGGAVDVCVAGGVSEQPGSGEVEVAVRVESAGRSD